MTVQIESLITLENWSMKQLTDAYNEMAKVLDGTQVKRFATKSDAIRRVWDSWIEWKSRSNKKPANKPAKSPGTPRQRRGTNLLPPGHLPKPCRAGTKQALMVDLLSREEGASMEELIGALSNWREVTVRSGFGWDMKVKGYGVKSRFVEGIERFYLVVPNGQQIPAHIPRREK